MTLQEMRSRFQALPTPETFGHVAAHGVDDVANIMRVARGVIEYGQAYGQLAALAEYSGEFQMSTFLQFKPVLERMLLRAETAFHARS